MKKSIHQLFLEGVENMNIEMTDPMYKAYLFFYIIGQIDMTGYSVERAERKYRVVERFINLQITEQKQQSKTLKKMLKGMVKCLEGSK